MTVSTKEVQVSAQDKWDLLDKSDGKSKGYLEIRCNGRRVADAFPYSGHADAGHSEWVRRRAQEIVDRMNAPPTDTGSVT